VQGGRALAARDAEYDAIVEWGIPDHGALQRLTGIGSPPLVIQGDADQMIPTKLSHLLAGLIPDAKSASTPTRRTPSSSRSRTRSPPTSRPSWHDRRLKRARGAREHVPFRVHQPLQTAL
jgi:hypothetical protein